MTFSDGRPAEGQNLPLDWNGKIVVDIRALKRLQLLANNCSQGLDDPRNYTILLNSLDAHLIESTQPEPFRTEQALVLLNLYQDAVPSAIETAISRLEEMSAALVLIMKTAERADGGNNE
jgi:hypothetical protein